MCARGPVLTSAATSIGASFGSVYAHRSPVPAPARKVTSRAPTKATVLDHVVYEWMRDQAAVDEHRVVGMVTPERCPFVDDERAYRRAVASGRELDRVAQRRVLDVRDPAQRVAEDVAPVRRVARRR